MIPSEYMRCGSSILAWPNWEDYWQAREDCYWWTRICPCDGLSERERVAQSSVGKFEDGLSKLLPEEVAQSILPGATDVQKKENSHTGSSSGSLSKNDPGENACSWRQKPAHISQAALERLPGSTVASKQETIWSWVQGLDLLEMGTKEEDIQDVRRSIQALAANLEGPWNYTMIQSSQNGRESDAGS